jgi:hypothetical protein
MAALVINLGARWRSVVDITVLVACPPKKKKFKPLEDWNDRLSRKAGNY